MTAPLPILALLPALRAALSEAGTAVLEAEPGAGKTTGVPPGLLDEPWLAGRRIVMLEPRRVAARAAARRIAECLGEKVGATAGYRVRFDSNVGPGTRIEVVTEGILTRLLQNDPGLDGIGLVIFDEFHERSLNADVGLALALQARTILRPDLRLLVMSATLDGDAVAGALGGAPRISTPGRVYPVETRYRPPRAAQRIEPAVTGVIREALRDETGDLLVFLPGAGEIGRVQTMLAEGERIGARVLPLHGSLAPADQDAALTPSGERRVILATSIAETSLTIEGVRVVIDGGLMRVPRYSPRTDMTRLETVRVTRASADQRRGRAGRLGPGICYRLWQPADELGFMAHGVPEILAADLASLALDLAAAGVRDPAELVWLDPPPSAAFGRASELLVLLGAVDHAGRITRHGRELVRLGLHPRLAHMAATAKHEGLGALAADLAALLSDRDLAVRRGPEMPNVDLRLRVEALGAGGRGLGIELSDAGLHRARQAAREWRRRLGVAEARGTADVPETGRLLALAYPDRIGQRRAGQPGRFLLQNGRGASLDAGQPLAREDFLVAAELDDRGAEARISVAAPLDSAGLEQAAGGELVREELVEWDAGSEGVVSRERLRFGALVLDERRMSAPSDERAAAVLLEQIRLGGLRFLPWRERDEQLRARLAFLHGHDPTRWPDVSDEALLGGLDEWLGPHLHGLRRRRDLDRLALADLLLARLGWAERREVDELAPERVEVPSGSRVAIDYSDPAAPVLAVRLQEVFGWTTTPTIGRGKVALTLHLLSPARRPMQVTKDLAGFWRGAYFEVRKELRARYPRHEWPEDPLSAKAVRGPKRRR
ncbi:MAG: ATP-dependent helicase HrpB [Gemmatimonadota bacterium]